MSRACVAVVVATHNRRAMLGRLLDALDAQVTDVPFEVIVVDDASSDDTFEYLQARAADSRVPLRPVRQPTNRGPAAARNRAWRATDAPLVLFTDDDCAPQPTWVARMAAALADVDIVQGRTIPRIDQKGTGGAWRRTIEVTWEHGFYETCNMGYRREWIERADGFDERFRFPFGEDADLAWRCKEQGATTRFDQDAVVEHELWASDYRRHLAQLHRHEGIVLLVSVHRGIRDRLPTRWFFRVSHPWALAGMAAATGVALRPRHALGWLVLVASGTGWAVAYATHRFHPRRRRDWPVVFAQGFVADVYEMWVLGRASVRYRTFLL